jgi:hypothetical protein
MFESFSEFVKPYYPSFSYDLPSRLFLVPSYSVTVAFFCVQSRTKPQVRYHHLLICEKYDSFYLSEGRWTSYVKVLSVN